MSLGDVPSAGGSVRPSRPEGSERDQDPTVGRLVGLSDAVFAIAMTLLAVGIPVPQIGDGRSSSQLAHALASMWPNFTSYGITFAVIAAYWHQHRRAFRWVVREDEVTARLNLLFLFLVAFLPFPSTLVGRYPHNWVAVAFFDVSLVAVGVVFVAMWRYFARANLLDPDTGRAYRRWLTERTLGGSAVFAASAVVAPWSTTAARLVWIALAAVLPVAGYRRARADRPDRQPSPP